MDIRELSPEERAAVGACFLFAGVDAALLDAALADEGCETADFRRGETIERAGAGLLLRGEVSAESLSGSRKLYLRTIRPGSIFGVASLFGLESEAVSALTALRESRALFFTQGLLEELMRRESRVAENYIRFLSGRVRYLNRKIACLTAGSVDAMLALRLLDEPDGTLSVRSFASLARELGVGRASLYRALDKLTEAGGISRDAHEIRILDKKQLEDMLK